MMERKSTYIGSIPPSQAENKKLGDAMDSPRHSGDKQVILAAEALHLPATGKGKQRRKMVAA